MTARGVVLPLTAAQRVTRMRWLAGEATIDQLDAHVRRPSIDELHTIPGYEAARMPLKICDIYYLLKDHNGGKDPTALDFADRWSAPDEIAREVKAKREALAAGHTKWKRAFVNRTADCIGGMAWCGGFDRYQPVRFAHIYGGWVNTDSMIQDARGPAKCFKLLSRPEPGCFVVFASGQGGHKVGHIGGVIDVPAEWDLTATTCWNAIGVVDMAARVGPGNRRGNPLTWKNAGGVFIVSTMTP
jgi:hypothetical protein